MSEFIETCNKIFEIDKKTGKPKGMPDGCDKCEINDEWQCEDGCLWPENAWKYEDVNRIIHLFRMFDGGFDLNRLSSLETMDFIKISFVKKYMR